MTSREDLFLKFIFEDMWNKDEQMKKCIMDFLADFVDIAPTECSSADMSVVAENLRSYVLKTVISKPAQQPARQEFLQNAASRVKSIMDNMRQKAAEHEEYMEKLRIEEEAEEKEYQEYMQKLNEEEEEEEKAYQMELDELIKMCDK